MAQNRYQGGLMISRVALRLAPALAGFALIACDDETTAPSPVTEEVAVAPTLAATATANQWITRADMPGTERWGLVSAVVPNAAGQSIFYAIGGSSSSSPQPINLTSGALTTVHAYNVATNEWTRRYSMPLDLYKSNGAGVIGGKIYVAGGRQTGDKKFSNALLEYNPVTNRWSRKQDMPWPTWGGITGVINNQLYVIGCGEEELCAGHERLGLARYNPSTNQWTELAPTPVPLGSPMGGVLQGKLYVTGRPGTLLMYDPATNTWTEKAPMPRPRWSAASVTLRGRLYILGGFQSNPDGSVARVRTVSVYNPNQNSWSTRAQMPTHRFDFTASAVFVDGQSRIEAVGGERPGNNLQYIP
jgi:N-acetylneuraminic acid mutarotase